MIRFTQAEDKGGGHDLSNREYLVRQFERWQQLRCYFDDKLEEAERHMEFYRRKLYEFNEKGDGNG